MVKALNTNLSQFYKTFISKIDQYDGTHFDFVTCTSRGCLINKQTGLNIKIGIAQKVYEL